MVTRRACLGVALPTRYAEAVLELRAEFLLAVYPAAIRAMVWIASATYIAGGM